MDAQRNRARILEVAKDAFARSGAGTSLDDIAKQAGVGAGTLYRHFPTRDALLEAVYRTLNSQGSFVCALFQPGKFRVTDHLLWSATWKQSPTYLIFVSRPKSRTIHSDGALS
jgi:hypothetical protein